DQADALLRHFRSSDPDQRLLSQLALMRECVSDPVRMDWDGELVTSRIGPFDVEGASVLVLLAGKSLSAGGQQLACSEGAFRALLGSENAGGGERWGAFLGLQGALVATGRDEEAHALIDSVAAIYGAARSLYVLGSLAGASMDDAAEELDSFAQERFGADYGNVSTGESLWVLSAWHHHLGDRDRFDRVVRAIAPRGAALESSLADRRYAAAVQARGAYWDDPHGPLDSFSRLAPSGPDDLEWSFGEHLAPDRLLHAEALLGRGQYHESEIVASAFDHPGPIMFLQFLPASLAIRHEAALALGDARSAETYRARLGGLGRLELLDNP
ncbi:MAG: hypothetical protein OEU54_17400, partial [Gemmatimonadota bacterium]|nr:hypothetical protein [Gemmatimonadota bacterium]